MPTTITFTDPADWAAKDAAEKWCADRGISVGRLQANMPRGLLFGVHDIQKWRNLTLRQRRQLDGTMLAENFRRGPVTVRLSYDIDPAPVGADQREVA